MGYESVTDDKIQQLLQVKKKAINPNARRLDKEANWQINYKVESQDEQEFQLYTRQNKEIDDDFSCGLSWLMPSGEVLTLCRYNGPSHNHKNLIEGEELGYTSHIHKASEKYILANKKPEGHAIATDRYRTLPGALSCLVKDCKISGIETKPDWPSLFVDEGL